MDARRIRNRRRRPGIKMAPDLRAETEHAEQHERARSYYDQPFRQNIRYQRLCANATCHGHETCTHPGAVSPFSGKYCAVSSELGPPVGAVFDPRRAPLHLGRAVLYVALALSFSLVSTTFGVAILKKMRRLTKVPGKTVGLRPIQLTLVHGMVRVPCREPTSAILSHQW
jgi:hypothetical protein